MENAVNCVANQFGDTNADVTAIWTQQTIELPTAEKTGYTFQGWYTAASGETQITASTKMGINPTYYAHWTINKYKQIVQVRYQNADGSYGGYSNVINKDYEHFSTVTWSRAQDATYNAASYPAFTVTANTTKNLNITRRTYTVVWNANGGTGGYTGTYRYGQVAWAPGTSKAYWTCTGWTANGFTVTGNTTSTANWRKNTLTIYYHRNGGTINTKRKNNDGVNADPCSIHTHDFDFKWNLRSYYDNDTARLPMTRKRIYCTRNMVLWR